MCGILALFGNNDSEEVVDEITDRQKFVNLSKRMRHRGPDWSGVWLSNSKRYSRTWYSFVGKWGNLQLQRVI